MSFDYANNPEEEAKKIRDRLRQFNVTNFTAHFEPTWMKNKKYGATKVGKVRVIGDKVTFYSSSDKRRKAMELQVTGSIP